ncbi:MAG: Rrf2 family transcriptional regulator [Clostridiales Family XIII bacterium]|jgi:Rrf2 family protein|nr:Rrf2 family transcriptional regulator [Clostridiales Family XIII bacterium]
MRISVKGRYALAAVIVIADKQASETNVTVGSISEELGVSKIYLEQVFAQLKKVGLLTSTKGPKGGYQFARAPIGITVWEVLSALETGLSEQTENTVGESDPGIEMALRERIYDPVDLALKQTLSAISVQDLHDHAVGQRAEQSFMMGL